jgi:hypothetical protein
VALDLNATYTPAQAAEALNVSEKWAARYRDRAIRQGLVKEQGKQGSGLLLGSDYRLICRKFYQAYEDGVRWHCFNRQREREGLGTVGEV